MKSVVAAPSCTSPILWILPVSFRIRSVVVVLPASTWAKMPIFLYVLKSFISSLQLYPSQMHPRPHIHMTLLPACRGTWSCVDHGVGACVQYRPGICPRATLVAPSPGPERLSGADNSSAAARKPVISKAIARQRTKWRRLAGFQRCGAGREGLAAQQGPPAGDIEQAHQRRSHVGQGRRREQAAGVRTVDLFQDPLLVQQGQGAVETGVEFGG